MYEKQAAFAKLINVKCDNLYKCSDFVLISKIINKAKPGFILEQLTDLPAAGKQPYDREVMEKFDRN